MTFSANSMYNICQSDHIYSKSGGVATQKHKRFKPWYFIFSCKQLYYMHQTVAICPVAQAKKQQLACIAAGTVLLLSGYLESPIAHVLCAPFSFDALSMDCRMPAGRDRPAFDEKSFLK